jgi:hypothetical protein
MLRSGADPLAYGKVALGGKLLRPPGDIDCFVVVSGAGRTKAQIDAAADAVLADTLCPRIQVPSSRHHRDIHSRNADR